MAVIAGKMAINTDTFQRYVGKLMCPAPSAGGLGNPDEDIFSPSVYPVGD